MLVHLSKSSPYLCDISLGPIEQANRMASLPTKRLLPYLEMKESFPKQTRTPLKLLAAEEIPLNTSLPPTASANDMNNSREQSLQPIWYTEQSIVDENVESAPSSYHVNNLQVIESDSPRLSEPSTSLMRKSSTFTIDPLNDSEKENDANIIITSTQKQTSPPNERSEESYRALEHLLGLGSANTNFTMTTTNHESPKSNHDTLSLTIVTPTDLINNTTAASLHLSYMPMGGGVGSLPSSQNVLLMPTIESTNDPSINTTMPAPFSVDNSDVDEGSPSHETTSSLAPENLQQTENSLQFTDDSDENNLSYPLNQSIETPTVNNIRPPTSADVAYRALIKPRTVGRISQPVKMVSPLASKTNSVEITVRSSLPAPSTRVLRSSTRRISIKLPEQISTNSEETSPTTKLIEVVTVPEEEEEEEEQFEESSAGVTLNLTVDKGSATDSLASAEDADCSALSSETSPGLVKEMETRSIEPLAPILSQEFSYNTPTLRPSARFRSNPSSPIPEASIEEDDEHDQDRTSLSSMKSNLSILSANTTGISEAPPIILQKSLVGSASPSPNATPIISSTRPSERLSMNFSPRRSINPLHSSTPSMRNKSLQIVSIGEEEQISTMAPEPFRTDEPVMDAVTMIDQEQQVNIPMEMVTDKGIQTSPARAPVRIEISTQTTPSLDPSNQRQFSAIEQQTTPITKRSFECQTTPIPIVVHCSLTQQTSPVEVEASPPVVEQEPHTPVHTKPVIQLRRNVRFQFTPSTDARLAAKEKLEDDQQRVKQEIPHINPTIVSDNEREDDVDEEVRKSSNKKKKKKKSIGSKKKSIETLSKVEESVEEIVREDLTMESPVLSIPSEPLIDAEDAIPKKKRSARIEKKSSPHEHVEVIVSVTSPPTTTKRINSRKRPNPKTSTVSEIPPETISPTEPVLKRAKTSETKHSTRVPSPEIPSTRSRSKTQTKASSSPESSTTATNGSNKRKHLTSSTTKKGKRRLHNAEQDEGLNTADEDEPIMIEPTAETEIDLTAEEREKIEAMTVVELKNRLTTHGETIPKGVRKADLIALVMKIEIQLQKERRQTETPVELVTHPPMRKTRRKKS